MSNKNIKFNKAIRQQNFLPNKTTNHFSERCQIQGNEYVNGINGVTAMA